MHSPLSVQEAAHLREASGPSPVRTMSRTPAITSGGLASPMPAGCALRQTPTHLPHLVQAPSICSTRSASAASKVMPLISCAPAKHSGIHYIAFGADKKGKSVRSHEQGTRACTQLHGSILGSCPL